MIAVPHGGTRFTAPGAPCHSPRTGARRTCPPQFPSWMASLFASRARSPSPLGDRLRHCAPAAPAASTRRRATHGSRRLSTSRLGRAHGRAEAPRHRSGRPCAPRDRSGRARPVAQPRARDRAARREPPRSTSRTASTPADEAVESGGRETSRAETPPRRDQASAAPPGLAMLRSLRRSAVRPAA